MSTRAQIRATPFHARTSASNPFNRWTTRNGFTLAQDFGDAQAEALAARMNVVLMDISWRWRIHLVGAGTADCLSHLMTRNVSAIDPGQSLKALWLNDGGAVRGAGVIARLAPDQFLVAAAATDAPWLTEAARQFQVVLRDVTEEQGGLALVGPYARAVLEAAGLEANLEPLAFRKLFWRGLDLTLSRWGEQDGFEIWCNADDCLILWDRLMRIGAPFAIRPAGLLASDILDVEAGIPRPERDYCPASDGFARNPSPESIGLESLIGETHLIFNGRDAWLGARNSVKTVFIGIEIDAELPAPFVPVYRSDAIAGHTLTSVNSPTLRRAIALAMVEKSFAVPGTEFSLTLPLSLESQAIRTVAARVRTFPFVDKTVLP
ncbi:MAG: glycine cleavage T C-terminal barrel domain-containing protein [Rhizomicrobium sp.]